LSSLFCIPHLLGSQVDYVVNWFGGEKDNGKKVGGEKDNGKKVGGEKTGGESVNGQMTNTVPKPPDEHIMLTELMNRLADIKAETLTNGCQWNRRDFELLNTFISPKTRLEYLRWRMEHN
jgi:hypothetical protein